MLRKLEGKIVPINSNRFKANKVYVEVASSKYENAMDYDEEFAFLEAPNKKNKSIIVASIEDNDELYII